MYVYIYIAYFQTNPHYIAIKCLAQIFRRQMMPFALGVMANARRHEKTSGEGIQKGLK